MYIHCNYDPDHMCMLPGRGSPCWTVPTWQFGLWTAWCRWCRLPPFWTWWCMTAAWAGGCPSPAPRQSSTSIPPLTTLVSGDGSTNSRLIHRGGKWVLLKCFNTAFVWLHHFVLLNRRYLLAESWNCALNLLGVSERGKFLPVYLIYFFQGLEVEKNWRWLNTKKDCLSRTCSAY